MNLHEIFHCEPLRRPPAALQPLLVRPRESDQRLRSALAERPEPLVAALKQHAVVIFRDFIHEAEFDAFADLLAPERFSYVGGSTPRTHLGREIYTATEYPASQTIPLHIESAYQRRWPMRLLMHCREAATTGGETTLACTRAVTSTLDPDIVEAFGRRGVTYLRNYREHMDLPWQQAFRSESRDDVATYCRSQGIEFEWVSDTHLRTRQRCQGLARHPGTGDLLWCNQAHLFHPSALPSEVREALTVCYGPEDLPRNALFGDGETIPDAMLARVREVYAEQIFAAPWQTGDLLVADNMLVHHGRNPFEGSRDVRVTLGGSFPGPAYPPGSAWSETPGPRGSVP